MELKRTIFQMIVVFLAIQMRVTTFEVVIHHRENQKLFVFLKGKEIHCLQFPGAEYILNIFCSRNNGRMKKIQWLIPTKWEFFTKIHLFWHTVFCMIIWQVFMILCYLLSYVWQLYICIYFSVIDDQNSAKFLSSWGTLKSS